MCDECGKNPANIHVTQITNSETTLHHLCEECAKKKGIAITIEDGVKLEAPQHAPAPAAPEIVCPQCGLKLSEFRESGWLGCAGCYASFSEQVGEMLVQMHGTGTHQGKRYEGKVRPRKGRVGLKTLKTLLENAVRNEDFERAAQLRDTIRSLAPERKGEELKKCRG